MKGRVKIISVLFFCLVVCFSCKTTREEYSSDKFIVVDVLAGDTFNGLAKKYLNDPDKDWLIREFNRTDSLNPGNSIIIPLVEFNKGGLKSDGYQIVPVLNYKGFSSTNDKKEQHVSLNEFKEQLSFLKSNGYRVISVEDMLSFMDYKIQIPEKSVVITANGDIDSFYEIALPAIETFKVDTTFFIDPLKIRKKKTWERIRKMHQKGVEIQSGVEIPDVGKGKRNGTLKDYFFNIDNKLLQSKLRIEKKLKTKCNLFASTSDTNNGIISNLLMKNGYSAALFVSKGQNPFFGDKYSIHMTSVKGSLTLDEFKKKTETFHKADLN